MKALGRNVLIRLDEPETVTSGGIVLPEQLANKRNIGVITSIGGDVDGVEVGQRVVFSEYSPKASGEKGLVFVDAANLLAVLETVMMIDIETKDEGDFV